jgi:hypothetical protein
MGHEGERRNTAVLVVGGYVAALVVAGCATVLGIDTGRRYVPPDDEGGSVDEGGSLDAGAEEAPHETQPSQPPGWACLNDPVPPTPSGNVELRMTINDVSGSNGATPISGAEIHACSKLDLTCMNPFGSVTTDDAGLADLMIPGGFAGYYEVRAQSFTNAMLWRTPMLAPQSESQGLVQAELIAASGSLANVTQDPTLSLAIVTVEDCTATVAAGMVLDVATPTANEKVVYLANNLPSQEATQTDSMSGTALIFNVPPGVLEMTAFFADTHNAVRTVSTLARDNTWVTYVQIRPDQATVHL